MEWPKVEVTSNKAVTEYKFIGGSWLPFLMCSCMLGTIFVPYFIVLIRGTLSPFLPYVSQVSGSPPQSGVFNVFIVLSCLLAFIGLNLMNMGIRVQKKRLQDEWVRQTASLLNKVSLIPGHMGILGMVIVGSYPIDFYRPSDSWFGVTIIPHLIGALSLFLGGLFYCIILTYILSLLHPEQKQLLGIRIFLVSLITMCSALLGYTVRDGFMNGHVDEDFLMTSVIEPHLVPYNMSYLIGSVCEWSLLLAFIVFFLTLKDEVHCFCFTMSMSLLEPNVAAETSQKTEANTTKKDSDKADEKNDSSEKKS